MPLMALRTGLAPRLCAGSPRLHTLPPPCCVPRRPASAASHGALRSPLQPLSHLAGLRAALLRPPAATAGGAAPGAEPTSLGSPLWQQFAAAASGEWEGVTVTFSPGEGGVAEPQELPPRYVPSAFSCAAPSPPPRPAPPVAQTRVPYRCRQPCCVNNASLDTSPSKGFECCQRLAPLNAHHLGGYHEPAL